MKEPFVITEQDLEEMAKKVTETLASSYSSRAKVLFLEGDLGAGKTTFTKALASVLGINKQDVHSPTFILKKEYKAQHPFFRRLIHIDAYRFDSHAEAKVLDLGKDTPLHDTLIVVEWPEKLGPIIEEDMTITFSVLDEERREIVINYTHGYHL